MDASTTRAKAGASELTNEEAFSQAPGLRIVDCLPVSGYRDHLSAEHPHELGDSARRGATRSALAARVRGGSAVEGSPPCVIRGAECPPPSLSKPESGVYLTLDWVRACGPDGLIHSVREFLVSRFGEPEARDGLYFCKAGEVYPGGVKLLYDHPSGVCVVEASGSALAPMTAKERVEFVQALKRLGLHGTRIDLAGDFVDQGLVLYDSALASCKADELCGARVFNSVESRTVDEWKGRTLYIGLRGGNGSGRFVRIYDKGLETQTGEVGEWERYEVEFTDQPARMAFALLADAPDWAECHKSLMLGAVEFRVATGDAHRSRRPLVAWWAAMVQAVETVRHAAARPLAEFKRWKKWAAKCVIPTLDSMCRKMNIGFEELLVHLAEPSREPKHAVIGGVIDQARQWWEDMQAGADRHAGAVAELYRCDRLDLPRLSPA